MLNRFPERSAAELARLKWSGRKWPEGSVSLAWLLNWMGFVQEPSRPLIPIPSITIINSWAKERALLTQSWQSLSLRLPSPHNRLHRPHPSPHVLAHNQQADNRAKNEKTHHESKHNYVLILSSQQHGGERKRKNTMRQDAEQFNSLHYW